MRPFIKYSLKLIRSVLFSISILLPVSITVFPVDSIGGGDFVHRQDDKMVWFGVGSIHAILDSVCDANPDDPDRDGTAEGNRVLVSQGRALVRIPLTPKPLISMVLAPAPVMHLFIHQPLEYNHPESTRFKDSEIFLTLNTGVSPPAPFFPVSHS